MGTEIFGVAVNVAIRAAAGRIDKTVGSQKLGFHRFSLSPFYKISQYHKYYITIAVVRQEVSRYNGDNGKLGFNGELCLCKKRRKFRKHRRGDH
jgi:hypothetical protein